MATGQGHSPLDVRGRILQQAGFPTSLKLATNNLLPRWQHTCPKHKQGSGEKDQVEVAQVARDTSSLACEPVKATEVALDRKKQRGR